MGASRQTIFAVLLVLLTGTQLFTQPNSYPWLSDVDPGNTIARRIPVPPGYERIPLEPGSFSFWLRNLPLKKGNPRVMLFNRKPKANQSVHMAVIDIDTGNRDLQQCADAVIRLRAEYLFSRGKIDDIHFRFTSGDSAEYRKWSLGFRPVVSGNRVYWKKSSAANHSYANFRDYLDTVFIYAGTDSLYRELHPVKNINRIEIGDVFIQPGFPGHAVLVVDMARKKETGKKIFLLAQSYMPAQDIHILKNPENQQLNPWVELQSGEVLKTPEWEFRWNDLRRF